MRNMFFLLFMPILTLNAYAAASQTVEISFGGKSAKLTQIALAKVGPDAFRDLVECESKKACILKLEKQVPASLYLIPDYDTSMLVAGGLTGNSLYDFVEDLYQRRLGKLQTKLETITERAVDPRFARTYKITTYQNDLLDCVSDNDVTQRFTNCKLRTIFDKDVTNVYNTKTGESFSKVFDLPYGY